MAALWAALLLIALVLEGCAGLGPAGSTTASVSSPTSTSSASPTLAATPAGGSGGSGGTAVRFSLTLFAEPVGVKAFLLYVQMDDAKPRITPFCGLKPAPACDIAHSPFSQVVESTPGASLNYRFEELLPHDAVKVLDQGTANVQPGTSHIGAAYPQTPT
jgi:hypothetical protein